MCNPLFSNLGLPGSTIKPTLDITNMRDVCDQEVGDLLGVTDYSDKLAVNIGPIPWLSISNTVIMLFSD